MAAKKKSASKPAASTPTPTPTRTVVTSADAQPIDEPARKQGPQAEKVPTPTIEDPTLSSDNRHSVYKDNNAAFPPGTGNQMVEIPGKPDAER